MLNDDEVRELTQLYDTLRKARTVLLLSDVPYQDIAKLPTDIGEFWQAMARLYKNGYAPDTERRLRANVREWLPGNEFFPASSAFSPTAQQLIAAAMGKVEKLQEIEAAADLLTVRAISGIDDANDIFVAALQQLRGVVVQRPATGQALLVLEAEGAQYGQVRDETKRQLVDALTRVISADEQFGRQVTQAVRDARDAQSTAGNRMNVNNTIQGNASGNVVQTGTVFGGLHFAAPPPEQPPHGDSPEPTA